MVPPADSSLTAHPARFALAMPVRGWSPFLGRALASLRLQQAAFDLAVLDASEDDANSGAIKGAGAMVTHLRHGPDAGQAAAIADGWRTGKGEFLGWLNADDFLMPGCLAAVATCFAANPEADVVFGRALLVGETGEFLGYFPTGPDAPRTLHNQNELSQPSVFIRRRALEAAGGLNESLHFIMDWDLWLRLRDAGARFVWLDQVLSGTALRRQTKTAAGGLPRLREIWRLLRRHNALPPTLRTLSAIAEHDCIRYGDGVLARLLRRRVAARLARRGEPVYRGLGIWSGTVRGPVLVELPWFDTRPPAGVRIVADGNMASNLVVNGHRLPVHGQGADLGGIPAGQFYRIEITFAGNGGALRSVALA